MGKTLRTLHGINRFSISYLNVGTRGCLLVVASPDGGISDIERLELGMNK
ncbi:MAG: hypothetical protein Q3Y16_12305 [Bacteroides sp.]|nr:MULTISPECIES: hypothetical protein [Bacteroides]MDR3822035.1 hypothetical protein [Bacteroides sp.]